MPSLADQGPAAAELTTYYTVARLVSPGHPAPHAEMSAPAMSAVPVQASTPVNRSCHAVIALSMYDPALLLVHPYLVPVEQVDELHDLQGKWCVVRYFENAYHGIDMEVEDLDKKVKCMNSVGVNRFYWPAIRDDVCWYNVDDVLFLIPEPEKVGSRHVQIRPNLWELIQQYLPN